MIVGPPIASVTLEAADLPYTFTFDCQQGTDIAVSVLAVGGDVAVEASLFRKLPQDSVWDTIFAASTAFGVATTTNPLFGTYPLYGQTKMVFDSFGVGTVGTAITVSAAYVDNRINYPTGMFSG